MIRVEFIGSPGSGKSTIFQKLAKQLRNEYGNRYLTIEEAFFYVSKSKIDRLYRFIMRALPHNIAFKFCKKILNRSLMQFEAQNRFIAKWGNSLEAFLVSHGFDQIPNEEKKITISGFLEIGSLFECIIEEIGKDKVVLFDEGFVQKSFMFLSGSGKEYVDQSNLVRYLENIPLPDLIIHVRARANLCYKRMLDRPQGLTARMMRYEKKSIMNFLERADAHLQCLVLWLKKNSNVRVVEIYNEDELGASLKYLSSEIKFMSSLSYFKDEERE